MKSWLYFLFFTPLLIFSQKKENSHSHSNQQGFIENKGQWDEPILFKTKFDGGNLWIQQHKFVFHFQDFSGLHASHFSKEEIKTPPLFRQDVIHLNFVNSNEVSQIEKKYSTPEYYNYFIGKDSTKWKGNVKSYEESILKNLYHQIDLKIINNQGAIKYEFHVDKQIDPTIIALNYVGQKGIKVNKNGELEVTSSLGKIIEEKPYAYQEIDGVKIEVSCDFALVGDEVKFKLGNYNRNYSLVIDPDLIFATYSGSVTDNFGMTATYGHDGTAYSGGTVFGNAYPTPDDLAYDINSNFTVANFTPGSQPPSDVFLSKYSTDGSQMLWTTFLGGGDDTQGTETAHSLICDSLNNLYVYGVTSSLDFPIQGGFQSSHGGGEFFDVIYNGAIFGSSGTDIFVAKISSNGHNLLASTYIGGSLNDGANYNEYGRSGNYGAPFYYDSLTRNYGDQFRGEIMLDSLSNCLIASCTRSTNFPVLNAFQASNAGQQDGVIFKLNSNLSALIFSTYIGGTNNDACYSVKIDSSYNIIFAGGTSSTDLPQTTGSYQNAYGGGIADGFVGKLNSDGSVLQRISYIGTTNYDQAFFVEIDEDNKIYLLGQSNGGLFPIVNAGFSNPGSGQFIVKLSEDLTVLENSTVFGSGNSMIDISPSAFLVDICGNIYVSGWGGSVLGGSPPISGLPVTTGISPPNGYDFYLLVMESDFSTLKFATYLGGQFALEHVDGGTSRFDVNGIVYQSVCGGCGGNSDFPTTANAWSNQNLSTNCNNLVFKFDFKIIGKSDFTVGDTSGCSPFQITLQNNSANAHLYTWDFGDGTTSSTNFNPTKTYNTPGLYVVYLATRDTVCDINDTMKINIVVDQLIQLNLPNDSILCEPANLNLSPSSSGTADQFIWSSQANFSDTINTNLLDSSLAVSINGIENFYLKANNLGCENSDSIHFDVVKVNFVLQDQVLLCNNDSVIVQSSSNGNYPFTYVWSPPNMIQQLLNDTTIQLSNQNSGYLYVDVASINNCTFKDSIFIQISPNSVNLQAFGDTVICVPTNINLVANSFGSSNNFIWSTSGSFSDTLNSPLTDSTYLFLGQNSQTFYVKAFTPDCQEIDTVRIQIINSEVDLISDGQVCQDEEYNVNLVNNSGINLTYTWRPQELIKEQTSTTSVIANTGNPAYIFVDVSDPLGCSYTDSAYIDVSALTQSSVDAFASDTIVLTGSEVTLTANPFGNYNYQWTPQATLSNPLDYQTQANITQTTTFYVQINEGNCTAYDTITIYCYNNECKPPQVYVPNAFSPNGKGKNDVLYVRGPNIAEMLFRVYNRWGELVFETTDQTKGWDGTFKGRKVDPDVFDYYLDVKCIGGNGEIIKGNVTVLK